jgi:hypothetical protein
MDETYFEPIMEWAFFPGRHLTGFHYPYSRGYGPSWDLDGDGIPNRLDPFPFSGDPWNPWMCDPWYGSWGGIGFGWGPFGGWNWGWDNHFRNNWRYWGYWGGPGHYTDIDIIVDHDGNNVHWRDYMARISKDQLRDPNYRGDVRDTLRQLITNREAHRIVLDKNQLQQRDQLVKSIDKANYDMLRKNPQIRMKDSNGRERTIIVNPSDYKPDPSTGRISTERIIRRSGEGNYSPVRPGTIREPGTRNIREGTGSGKVIKKEGETSGAGAGTIKKGDVKKEGSGTIKKKDDSDRSYSLDRGSAYSPSSPGSATPYQPRSTTTYPSRIQQDDLTRRIRQEGSRLIIPNQQEVKKYSSPTIRDMSYTHSVPGQSRSTYNPPRIASQPRNSIGKNYIPSRSYSPPSIRSRSNPIRSSSSSYRSSGSRSSGSGSARKK